MMESSINNHLRDPSQSFSMTFLSQTNTRYLLYSCLLLISFSLIYFITNTSFDHDEIEHLHASWLIANGSMPYIDFFEHHHPTLWFMLSPLMAVISNYSIATIGIRFLFIINLLLSATLLYTFNKEFIQSNYSHWIIIALISSFAFMRNMIQLRPDPLMVIALCYCVLNLCRWIKQPSAKWMVAAGVWAGIATIILQKAGLFTLIIFAIFTIHMLIISKNRIQVLCHIALSTFAGAMTLGLFYYAFYYIGLWPDFFFHNYTFNTLMLSLFSDTPFLHSLPTLIRAQFLETLSLTILGSMSIFAAITIYRHHRKHLSYKHHIHIFLIIICIASYLAMLLNPVRFQQYLLFPIASLALTALCYTSYMSSRMRYVIIIIILLNSIFLCARVVIFTEKNDPQINFANHILTHTQETDHLAIPPPYHPIFRKNSPYLWFNGNLFYHTLHEYQETYPHSKIIIDRDVKGWHDYMPELVVISLDIKGKVWHWDHTQQFYDQSTIPNMYIKK